MNSIINYLDKFTSEVSIFLFGLLLIVSAAWVWLYIHNRKKYHNLKHQIPASVVKNYLDSIIQNSTALKSSLFRGGGLDVDPNSVPSVMPLDQLKTAPPVVGSSIGDGGDEALKAEVARLQGQLAEKENIIKDLESKNVDLEGTVKAKQERIEELEKLLAEANEKSGETGGSPEVQAQLDAVTAERDQLKEDLAQYDIIEDDLADLKRLKQENEQLKAALEEKGGAVPTAEAPSTEEQPSEEVAASEPTPVVEEPVPTAEETATEEVAAEAAPVTEETAAPEETIASEEDKSPEDLLSEFEKMLG